MNKELEKQPFFIAVKELIKYSTYKQIGLIGLIMIFQLILVFLLKG